MSGSPQESEPEAKILHTKRLYRAVVECVHKLDIIVHSKSSYREVFKPENISLRNKLRELCVKLMFLHPVDYGRKGEELLWRKVYYEVIQVIKTNKKHIHSRSTLECAYRTHLIAGVGFYQHLLLYIQSHYQLELQDCIDWTHVTDPLIGRKKPVSATPKEMEWAQNACHRCLVYLGDLARYQNELAGVEAETLAERFYQQALSVTPNVGMPFNQLGTLAGSKYYNVEATYYYLRCIQSEMPFDGAYGNLKRLFEKAAKMYHQVKRQEMKKLSPARQRSKDIKRLLVSFMYLQSLLQPKNSLLESELTSLCQSVLEDFNLVLFYQPGAPHCSPTAGEEEEDHDARCSFLPDTLVFRMGVTCLMVVHSLKRAGSKQYSAAIAFTLALFSHLVNHVNIRLQAELEEGDSQVPPLHTDHTDDPEVKEAAGGLTSEEGVLQNGTAGEEEEREEGGEAGKRRGRGGRAKEGMTEEEEEEEEKKQQQQKKQKKYSRLSMLRRRRYARKEDESDLSEGFESEEEDEEEEEEERDRETGSSGPPASAPQPGREGKPQPPEGQGGGWESASEEEEEGGTAFDVDTDSDMNSQESRSDLEDMEDAESHGGEEGGGSDPGDPRRSPPDEVAAPPASNGPSLASDPSITSNLQAMSSQLFQSKRCFRLAPTFSNVLLRPQNPSAPPAPAPSQFTPSPAGELPAQTGPGTANGTNDNEGGSDSEGSEVSNHSSRNEKTLPEKLEILTNQGLLPAVKIFVDWLRTNTDIIVMCGQSSQSLWNRLSVLLNLLPDGSKMLEAGLGLSEEVTRLLSECEQPSLAQTLLLPEDLALRHLPALHLAHRRLDFARERPSLGPLQECVVRVCCIRSFGHYLTNLQGNVLHFNPEAGIFTSISQSEQENLVQLAKAQFRMVREQELSHRPAVISQYNSSSQYPTLLNSLFIYVLSKKSVFSQHRGCVSQLEQSCFKRLIIAVFFIDGLDVLKKENAGARDGIRFLESEFRKGNRYIRCQRESGKSFERDKLKRQDIDAWQLYKILDSCRQLTLSQSSAEDDTAGMVTILAGHPLPDPSALSPHMQAAVQAVLAAGIELKSILDFFRQWKEMG
uniref:Nonsense-mediated mRNA decay factor n=1 Tax=Lepisosteus oculatus TaxID=7918 RepID=W5MP89_LEPOC